MPEKRRKRPRDPAQLAKLMIDIASGARYRLDRDHGFQSIVIRRG